MAQEEEKSFERALEELEKLAQDMEQRELPLEEAVAKFEQGIGLSQYCKELLAKAEAKIVQLTKDNKLEEFLKPEE